MNQTAEDKFQLPLPWGSKANRHIPQNLGNSDFHGICAETKGYVQIPSGDKDLLSW